MFRGMPDDFNVEQAHKDSFSGALDITKDHFGGESKEYFDGHQTDYHF